MAGFREADYVESFRSLIADERHEHALSFLLEQLPELAGSRMHRKEKLNHLLYSARAIQDGGITKHGPHKLVRKATGLSREFAKFGLPHRKVFVDFGAGAHDPVALASYFYLNGFEQAVGSDLKPPRNPHYSGYSMFDILAHVNAFPERYMEAGVERDTFMERLRQFDLEAFERGDFDGGLAPLDGRVRFVPGDIVDLDLVDNSVSAFVSFAVFEHVVDVAGVLAFMHSKTAPGGLGFHFIDLADHRSYRRDGAFNEFSFLTQEEPPMGLNRLRKSEQIAAFQAAGFEVLSVHSRNEPIPEETRTRILPRWSRMDEDDLTAINVRLITRKI